MRAKLCCSIILLSALIMQPAQAVALSADSKQHVVQSVIKTHVVRGYEKLEDETSGLNNAISKACQSNGELDGSEVQSAYRKALSAWMSLQHIRFGPALKDDRIYRIQFWPDKHGQAGRQIRRLLAAPVSDIPSPDEISSKSVAIQGFPALERVVFPSKAPSAEARANHCALAISIGSNLKVIASQSVHDWSSYQVANPAETIELLVRNLSEQLEIIANLKLKRPLGASPEKARGRRAESWRSATSLQNIAVNYQAIADLFEGADQSPGLKSALAADGRQGDASRAISEHLSFAPQIISERKLILKDAVTDEDGRKFVIFLIEHTNNLRELVLEHLAPALDVNIGFNAQDGD